MREFLDKLIDALGARKARSALDEHKEAILAKGEAITTICKVIVYFIKKLESNPTLYASVDAVFRYHHPNRFGLAEIKFCAIDFITSWRER